MASALGRAAGRVSRNEQPSGAGGRGLLHGGRAPLQRYYRGLRAGRLRGLERGQRELLLHAQKDSKGRPTSPDLYLNMVTRRRGRAFRPSGKPCDRVRHVSQRDRQLHHSGHRALRFMRQLRACRGTSRQAELRAAVAFDIAPTIVHEGQSTTATTARMTSRSAAWGAWATSCAPRSTGTRRVEPAGRYWSRSGAGPEPARSPRRPGGRRTPAGRPRPVPHVVRGHRGRLLLLPARRREGVDGRSFPASTRDAPPASTAPVQARSAGVLVPVRGLVISGRCGSGAVLLPSPTTTAACSPPAQPQRWRAEGLGLTSARPAGLFTRRLSLQVAVAATLGTHPPVVEADSRPPAEETCSLQGQPGRSDNMSAC